MEGDVSSQGAAAVSAAHAQMAADLAVYSHQAQQNYAQFNRRVLPQWTPGAATATNSGSASPHARAPTGGVPDGLIPVSMSPDATELISIGPPEKHTAEFFDGHPGRRSRGSSRGSSAGRASASLGGAVAGMAMASFAATSESSGGDPCAGDDVVSTTSTEDEMIARYKAERLQAIMKFGNSIGGTASGAISDFGGSRDRLDSLSSSATTLVDDGTPRMSSRRSAARRSASGSVAGSASAHYGGSSSSSPWLNGLSTDTVENLRALEAHVAALDSRASHEDASRVSSIDRSRLLRLLRCKKSQSAAKKAAAKLAFLVDRLGLALMTYDDVSFVLDSKCFLVPDSVTAVDGSNVLLVFAARVPLLGELHIDASSLLRAAIFLIEGVSQPNERWTFIVDAAGLSRHQVEQRCMPLFGALVELVKGAYPIRVSGVAVYRLDRGSGATAVATRVALAGLELKHLASKMRRRVKYVSTLRGIVDVMGLNVAARTAGVEVAFQ